MAIFQIITFVLKGLDVNDDPNPEKDASVKQHWFGLQMIPWIEREPFPSLTLTLYDGITPNPIANAFNLKLAPIIDNLVPDIQYVGEEVAISGGGILSTPNQLNVKFIRSDGSISAVTEVYDLGVRGKGKFTVPENAASGFVSVGFTRFLVRCLSQY